MNKIQLKTIEELKADRANNCLPKGIRAIIVGQSIIFVKMSGGRWMPVRSDLQKKLELRHIIKVDDPA